MATTDSISRSMRAPRTARQFGAGTMTDPGRPGRDLRPCLRVNLGGPARPLPDRDPDQSEVHDADVGPLQRNRHRLDHRGLGQPLGLEVGDLGGQLLLEVATPARACRRAPVPCRPGRRGLHPPRRRGDRRPGPPTAEEPRAPSPPRSSRCPGRRRSWPPPSPDGGVGALQPGAQGRQPAVVLVPQRRGGLVRLRVGRGRQRASNCRGSRPPGSTAASSR